MLKNLVKRIISLHEGEKRCISRRELLHMMSLPPSKDRAVRLAIAELRRDGTPILFSTGSKHTQGGYFMPESPAELRVAIEKMRSYVIDECKVMAAWKTYGNRWLNGETQAKLIEDE